MAGDSTPLPVQSLSQEEEALTKGEWRNARAHSCCESSCSTVFYDSEGCEAHSESDTEKEHATEFSPADVDWILTALSKEQKAHLDQAKFLSECQRIFQIMDKDESGFLDSAELEEVVAHLIPEPSKAISAEDGRCLLLSIQSVLRSFDKDSDRQLSSEEFPDFVRFCYAWRSQQEQMHKDGRATNVSRPVSHGSPSTQASHCGAAHRLVRSASVGHAGFSPAPSATLSSNCSPLRLPPHLPPALPSKVMTHSASNPTMRNLGAPKQRITRSGSCSRLTSPEPSMSSSSSARPKLTRSGSGSSSISGAASARSRTPPISAAGSARSSRRPSKSGSRSNASSRLNSPEPAHNSKSHNREDITVRQMKALKALLKELAASHTTLRSLISVLMHNILAPDAKAAFSKDALDHVCEIVAQASKARFSPSSYGPVTTTLELAPVMQEMGHVALDPFSELDETALLVDKAIEAVVLLSLRWFAMKHYTSVPEMSDYQKTKWLPPAFSSLVGQILWRHRAADALARHKSTTENLHWITSVPGVREDLIDRCNAVFQTLCGSRSSHMKLSQWRKVIERFASNAELRPRVRRCDAVRACYGDALGHSESGMSRRSFKLMLVKTADLMNVHPIVLFEELALQAEILESSPTKSQ